MKQIISIAAICVLAGCLGSGGSDNPAASATRSVPTTSPSTSANNTFVGLLNGVRATAGAGPVAYDNRLGRAAQGHADDMLKNNFFSHTSSDGTRLGQRVSEQGYRYRVVGENIAQGQSDEADVLNSWQNSSGHRRNNEEPAFEDFGLAKAGSGPNKYWVLVLGAEQ